MKRRSFLNKAALFGLTSFIPVRTLEAIAMKNHGSNNGFESDDLADIIPAPSDPEQWKEWRDFLENWRIQKQKDLNYDGRSYLSEPFRWVTSDFACGFIMMYDEAFYDRTRNEYTIEKLIHSGEEQFGGYDSVVLWHAYPRIGLDERNQFDFYREMPHGLAGLKKVTATFHQSGIKVFINYNPWDTGTRREDRSDIDLLITIISSIGADGIFLDTMKNAPGFREKLDNVKPGIALEGEIALPVEDIQTHHMSWAQWFRDSYVPGVYRNKWFENRHMQHAIDRLNPDKTPLLQTAWMNGSGMLIWENVFGQWLGWNEKDKSIYRSVHSLQLYFAGLFCGGKWIPLSHESPLKGVFISSREANDMQLYTLINRNDSEVSGILMETGLREKMRHFDLVRGEEIEPLTSGGMLVFKGMIAAKGIAAFLSVSEKNIDKGLHDFLAGQKKIYNKFSENASTPVMFNIRKEQKNTKNYKVAPGGMVKIPAGKLALTMEYTFRECGAYGNVLEQISEAASTPLHSLRTITREADFKSFALDETPVTNSLFREFMKASGYKPAVSENFLKHWINGEIPAGKEDHPVVYVDLIDARAYAAWAGKRLPSEYEWQFAAQGIGGFNYPWGNEMENNKCNNNTYSTTTPVRAFPEGISPFGCYDMCGNTWELTESEHSDGHTRFVILKGGSYFKAGGSIWYMDGGPQKNSFFAKMLLLWPGLDRCSTVGFRCAADL